MTTLSLEPEVDQPSDPSAESSAVTAHGLLNQLAVIRGASSTLLDSWDSISAAKRAQLIAMARGHASALSAAFDRLPDVVHDLCDDDLARVAWACESSLLDGEEDERRRSLGSAVAGADQTAAVLKDVARGLPPGIVRQLADLRT